MSGREGGGRAAAAEPGGGERRRRWLRAEHSVPDRFVVDPKRKLWLNRTSISILAQENILTTCLPHSMF